MSEFLFFFTRKILINLSLCMRLFFLLNFGNFQSLFYPKMQKSVEFCSWNSMNTSENGIRGCQAFGIFILLNRVYWTWPEGVGHAAPNKSDTRPFNFIFFFHFSLLRILTRYHKRYQNNFSICHDTIEIPLMELSHYQF